MNSQQLHDTQGVRDKHMVVVGNACAESVVLFLPGAGGSALGNFILAQTVQAALGDACVSMVVDIESMIVDSAMQHDVSLVLEAMLKWVELTGPDRVVAIVGQSNGGLLALMLAHRMRSTSHNARVWLLDTYNPLRGLRRVTYATARALGIQIVKQPIAKKIGGNLVRRLDDERFKSTGAPVERAHRAFSEAINRGWQNESVANVHLIRAQQKKRHRFFLTRPEQNEFNVSNYPGWTESYVDVPHDAMAREGASEVAAILVAGISKHVARIAHVNQSMQLPLTTHA